MHLLKSWLRHGSTLVILVCITALAGCATDAQLEVGPLRSVTEQASTVTPAAAAAKPITVESINVVGNGDRVLVETTGSIKYTVFRLSEPPRLVVDMPGVDLSNVGESITVDNRFISDIVAVSYGGDENIGRITIGLKEDIDHDVKSGENSILVSLTRATPDGDMVNASVDFQGTVEELAPEIAAEPDASLATINTPVMPEPEAAETVKLAHNLLSVDSMTDGDNTIVKISADGTLGSYNAFELDSPARIVIDIWGIQNATGKRAVNVDDKYIKSVRIGNHPDKTRLVVDAKKDNAPPHSIKREGDTITLTLGKSAEAVAEPKEVFVQESGVAEAAVPQPEGASAKSAAGSLPAAAMPEPEPVTIAAVDKSVLGAGAVASNEPEPEAVEVSEPVVVSEPVASEPEPIIAPEPEMAAETMAPAPSVEVLTVNFKRLPDKARLNVALSGKADYDVKESEGGNLVAIDIRGAIIPEDLKRTLDATRLNTPVQAISSYQESLMPSRNVRILVRLAEKTTYNVKAVDGTITADFDLITAKQAAEIASKAEAEAKAKAAEAVYTGKKIDLDMTDANISDVLRLMAEVSNLNIIASDDVKGTLSLRLKNVPWDQAFEIILKSKGLDMVRDGNVVRVAPAARIRQEKESALATAKAQERLEDLRLEFIPINYADAKDLIPQVKSVLTERGSVSSEARTNTLIVKDINKGIEASIDLVKRLDTPIPQVLIEARIVEATSSFARDLGIQWGVDYQAGNDTTTDLFGATSTTGQTPPSSTDKPVFETRHGAQNFAVNLPATGTAGTLGALGFIFGKSGNNPLLLDLRLTAGEQQGKLKTISRPRVTTLDNKEAKIEQGESVPYETTSASGTSTTFVDASLSLTVTPHITPDGSVLMKIVASRNAIGSFATKDGVPSIAKKEASTEVLVRNGETTVIGGIVVSDSNNSEKGIPLLKDIPLLGWLFKTKSVSDSQTELLIFITPTILKEQVVG